MFPKMAILDQNEYNEQFNLATILIDEGHIEQALDLLLKLKQKRWTKFELCYKIAQLQFQLNRLEEGLNNLEQINPLNQQQKQKVECLQSLFYYHIFKIEDLKNQQQRIDNQDIFKETQDLNYIQQIISNYYYLMNEQNQIQELSIYETQLLQLLSIKMGLYQFAELIQSIPNQNIPNKLIIYSLFLAQKYQKGLNMIQDNSEYLQYKAVFLKMKKQYKEALNIYKQSYSIRPDYQIQQSIIQLQTLIGENDYQYNLSLGNPQVKDILFQIKFNYLLTKNDQKIMSAMLKQMAATESMAELYYRLFLLEYSQNNKNSILQKICDYLIKYFPKCSLGYTCQYILLQDKQEIDKILQLIEPLQQCENSTNKYITIAKILRHKKDYIQAHITLEQARQMNEYEEEIYITKRTIYLDEKNYYQAHQALRYLVQLENENFIFVNQIISPMINKFEYYKVIDLLDYADQESDKFEELRILMRILSEEVTTCEDNIISDLHNLKSTNQFTYFGHYQLSKGEINEAIKFYELSLQTQNYNEMLLHIPKIKQGIQQLSNNTQKLKKYQINDIICQMSVYNYKSIQDYQDFDKRYIDTLGFVLISLLFDDDSQQICKFINSNYEIEVPYINGLKNIYIKNIIRIYCQKYIQPDQYCKYIEKGFEQIKNLLVSPKIGLEKINQFCSKNRKQIISLIIESDYSIGQLDIEIRKLYQYPYFYDPFSKYALTKIIKIIGYFTEHELKNNYNDIEEWLAFYLIQQNVEGYFQVISNNKTN